MYWLAWHAWACTGPDVGGAVCTREENVAQERGGRYSAGFRHAATGSHEGCLRMIPLELHITEARSECFPAFLCKSCRGSGSGAARPMGRGLGKDAFIFVSLRTSHQRSAVARGPPTHPADPRRLPTRTACPGVPQTRHVKSNGRMTSRRVWLRYGGVPVTGPAHYIYASCPTQICLSLSASPRCPLRSPHPFVAMVAGVQIHSQEAPKAQAEILTDGALQFIAALHRTFDATRQTLLFARESVQQRLDAGVPLDFPPETAHIRADPSWLCAPPAPGLEDRRVEITGPPDRKMVINALNSGTKTFMADFEGELSSAHTCHAFAQVPERGVR